MIIVDADNYSRILFHSMANYSLLEATTSWVTLGILRVLNWEILPHLVEDEEVVFVWDAGINPERRKIFPLYKYKVHTIEFDGLIQEYYKQKLFVIQTVIPLLGITQYMDTDTEADDIIYWLVQHNTHKKEHSLIYSSDKDFYQLVSKYVSIKPILKILKKDQFRRITTKTFSLYTKYETPESYLLYRALTGDQSDRIPGIPGIGETRGKKLAEGYDWHSFLRHIKTQKSNPTKEEAMVLNNTDILERNLSLMDLSCEQTRLKTTPFHIKNKKNLTELRRILYRKKYFEALEVVEQLKNI